MIENTKDFLPLFPWFGGKRTVTHVIWKAIGDCPNVIEPFFGSGAFLFLRPHPLQDGKTRIETVNDADGLLANFWRALKSDPDAVAGWADWIVSEADLHARHLWLVGQRASITERLCADPEIYDAKAAGWWLWGICSWIGGGWCNGEGPWIKGEDGVLIHRDARGEGGINRKLPHLGNAGQGINRQRPHLGDAGQGINRQLPHLGDAGRGINRQRPHLGDVEINECEARREFLLSTMRAFANRLRHVRVCCGDWSRICGPAVTYKHGLTGVFLDPPYSDQANRTSNIYAIDNLKIAHAVREWAIEMGQRNDMRIVLAGYEGEHEMPANWRIYQWKAQGGYACFGDKQGRENRDKERLWISPACLQINRADQLNLFT